jgi:hypothetical protein
VLHQEIAPVHVSGHGNSEEYRPWREVIFESDGTVHRHRSLEGDDELPENPAADQKAGDAVAAG